MNKFQLDGRRVWVAGNRGMVGSALVRRLAIENCTILASDGVDLRRQADVEAWMAKEKPDAIFMAAAKVGGIFANDTRPAEFLYDNILIEANVVEAAHQHKVSKLLMLGSSCIYPRLAPQPISEDMLLTGPLERTNEAYAIAKIAGIELCRSYRQQFGNDYISVMPTN
jgi:GDP-L-fucose synthase